MDPAEYRLAQLGYRQDLKRVLSHFGNFAVSFSLQSILAGITSESQLARKATFAGCASLDARVGMIDQIILSSDHKTPTTRNSLPCRYDTLRVSPSPLREPLLPVSA